MQHPSRVKGADVALEAADVGSCFYWVQNDNLVCMCRDQIELSEFRPLNYSSSHSLRIIGFLIITDCWRLSLYTVVLVLFPFLKILFTFSGLLWSGGEVSIHAEVRSSLGVRSLLLS